MTISTRTEAGHECYYGNADGSCTYCGSLTQTRAAETPADPLGDLIDPRAERCPKCGHAPHGKVCFNMASDNDCNCKGEPASDPAATDNTTATTEARVVPEPSEQDREKAREVFERWVTQSRPNVLDLIQLNTAVLVESFAQALADARTAHDAEDDRLREALRGVAVNHGQGVSLCWCPHNEITGLYAVEEKGEHADACAAARSAMGEGE